uniref:EGF-like domain-containing protein n=1 Tax=Graphocephala atropunctata TaxID=36148 RepID=A0A1B6LG93_9HEMI
MPSVGRVVAYLWWLLIFGVCGEHLLTSQDDRSCEDKMVLFNQCHKNETCLNVDTKGYICRCSKDYERNKDGSCQPVSQEPIPTPSSDVLTPSDSGGFGFKLLLWLAVPVLLALVIGVIVYTGRQKMWLNRLYRMRVRTYNNVLNSRPV